MPNYVLTYLKKRSVLKYGNFVTVGSPAVTSDICPLSVDIYSKLNFWYHKITM